MSSNFFPDVNQPQFDPYGPNRQRYEGLKAAFKADLIASENCFKRCQLNLSSSQISEQEQTCLRQCHVKYNEASLVVENEMSNFVRGLPM